MFLAISGGESDAPSRLLGGDDGSLGEETKVEHDAGDNDTAETGVPEVSWCAEVPDGDVTLCSPSPDQYS
jgi:hypothetical protein